MQIQNRTPFDVAVSTHVSQGGDQWFAGVIVKSTFDLASNGRLSMADEQMPIVQEPLATVYGVLPTELIATPQIDVCLCSTIHRRPTDALHSVTLRVGLHQLKFPVTGERTVLGPGSGDSGRSKPVPAVSEGDPVSIERVREAPIVFSVPPSPVDLVAVVGRIHTQITPRYSALYIWTDADKVVLIQRGMVAYRPVANERRYICVEATV